MTPLEGEMKVVMSFIAGLSKDDSNKLDTMFVCLSLQYFSMSLDMMSHDVI